MGYFDNKKNVEDYIAMADGYDGRELIARLREHVPEKATVLELGMGPGVDLDILADTFTATGSDFSRLFLDRYREKHGNPDLLLLDAVTIQTDRKFDAIYSNKVLHHLTEEELRLSLARQKQVLNPGGCALHSFWRGAEKSEMDGLQFNYYGDKEISKILEEHFKILDLQHYRELADDDSLYALLTIPAN